MLVVGTGQSQDGLGFHHSLPPPLPALHFLQKSVPSDLKAEVIL